MRILLIDNYDSFTYNVVHLLREVGADAVDVVRNTAVDLSSLPGYTAVIASPGPGLPNTSGALPQAVKLCLQTLTPYLGICLGHQALGEATGAVLKRLPQVRHGIQDQIHLLEQDPLFDQLPERLRVGRYHSWIVEELGRPDNFQALARSEDGVLQAARVAGIPAYGLQFHPESIMTAAAGPQILSNFLNLARQHHA